MENLSDFIKTDDEKKNISITLDAKIISKLNEMKVNKSKLINQLLSDLLVKIASQGE